MAANEVDEDYFLPLEDQRVFGAGIKRKRVPFVRSSDVTLNTASGSEARISGPSLVSVAERYLSIVLPQETSRTPSPQPEGTMSSDAELRRGLAPASPMVVVSAQQQQALQLCEVCHLPVENIISSSTSDADSVPNRLKAPHETSIAHQVCLAHSHPPSHLDRTRHGLRYLAAYGWDPDCRLGLGAPGREGIREPVKPKVKNDTVALGRVIEPRSESTKQKAGKAQKLNAKQVRRGELEAKRKGEKLREMFYRRDDVQRYLGDGG
jgi:hypothetical protein